MSTSPDRGFVPTHTGAVTRPAPQSVFTGSAAAALPLARQVVLSPLTAIPEHLLEPARERACSEGYAAGWAQGRRDAAAEALRAEEQAQQAQQNRDAAHRSSCEALHRAASALESHVEPNIDEMADLLAGAAFTLAEAILGREIELSPEPGRDAVRRALGSVPGGRPVTVSLHPSDLAEVSVTMGAESEVEGRRVSFVADPRLARGDALASSDVTDIDARISAALDRAREALQ